ncbi:MAG TPA: hypothetical protein VF647_02660 [Longimicrobium sp.]|jgi:tetratricopeptide (TPR) repeat protein
MTDSLGALKAYLEGESLLRTGDAVKAVEAYQRAVSEDTTFALAYYRLSQASTSAGHTSLMHDAAEAAVRHRGRLSARDQIRVHAWNARLGGDVASAEAAYHRLLHLYPDDLEATFQLADLLFHNNPFRGRSAAEARGGLERSLASAPTRREATDHLAKVYLLEGDSAALQRLRAHARSDGPDTSLLAWLDALEAAGRPGRGRDSAVARVRGAGDVHAIMFVWWAAVYGGAPSARALAGALLEPDRAPEIRAWGHLTRADLAAGCARWPEATRELAHASVFAPLRAAELHGLYSTLPWARADRATLLALRDTLARWSDARAGAESSPPFVEFPPGARELVRIYVSGLLSVRLDDAAAAGRAVQALRESRGSVAARRYGRALAAGVEAHLLRARGQPDKALAALAREPLDWSRDYGPVHFAAHAHERFLRAELLRETGHPAEALGWYATLGELAGADAAYLPRARQARADIYDRSGKTDLGTRERLRAARRCSADQ